MVYVHVKLTIVLCRCVQPQLDQLQLVDLVRKDLDKVLEDGYPLRLALLGVVELDESIGELVPQLALPEVLELDEEVRAASTGSFRPSRCPFWRLWCCGDVSQVAKTASFVKLKAGASRGRK
jgi:hypothetical protein